MHPHPQESFGMPSPRPQDGTNMPDPSRQCWSSGCAPMDRLPICVEIRILRSTVDYTVVLGCTT